MKLLYINAIDSNAFWGAEWFMNKAFLENKIDYTGTPYLVHAEVQGQGAISNLRYGHAWIEDDVFVYDYSNNRKIVLPKNQKKHMTIICQKHLKIELLFLYYKMA